ncbi:MAG: LON peptidase substrate-binding domain-containing protein, partial [Acidobacteria bacterium]|nr:LON peptidase substrate-binding domain-containing protein [Acidobacteriota bacterium]
MTDWGTERSEEKMRIPKQVAVLPLRDIVVYPYIIVPLSVSRDRSIQAINHALSENRMILLLSQKDGSHEEPAQEDLFEVGTVAVVMRMLKLPDGRLRVLVQGVCRARVDEFVASKPFLRARITRIVEPKSKSPALEQEALMRNVKRSLEKASSLGKPLSSEVMVIANNLEDPGRLADLAASNLELKVEEAQIILRTLDPMERLRKVNEQLNTELDLLAMQQEINSQAREEIDRSQREFFLRQQLKAIQSELGEGNELTEEVDQFREKAHKARMPKKVKEEVERQISRLEGMHPDSAETAALRNYLDWMVTLP